MEAAHRARISATETPSARAGGPPQKKYKKRTAADEATAAFRALSGARCKPVLDPLDSECHDDHHCAAYPDCVERHADQARDVV